MKTLKSIALSFALILGLTSPSWALVPWGSTAPLQVSGATPTCTYTTTALACIEDMTANVTSITLAGMTAGTTYTLVLMQDGTGSRTLTQTSVTGAPALTTAESAANGYAVWTITATSASAATFVSDYSNVSLTPVFFSANTSNGTSVSSGVMQGQGAIVAPGAAAATPCICTAQTLPATWQTGIALACLPATNSITCEEINPTAGSITPAAITLSAKFLR
jgi:hypothetical protein